MRIERPFNRHLADVGIELKARDLTRRVHRSLKRSVQFRAGEVVGRDERDAHGVLAGRYRDARRRAAVAGRVLDFLVPIEHLHPFAVDRYLELLARDLAQNSGEVAGDALYSERVFAVGRKLMLDEDAAAGSKRQPLDVGVLRRVGRHVKHSLCGSGYIANREPADLAGRRQIRLHQRRRHRQGAGDVVEAVRRIVGRQKLRRVDIEGK